MNFRQLCDHCQQTQDRANETNDNSVLLTLKLSANIICLNSMRWDFWQKGNWLESATLLKPFTEEITSAVSRSGFHTTLYSIADVFSTIFFCGTPVTLAGWLFIRGALLLPHLASRAARLKPPTAFFKGKAISTTSLNLWLCSQPYVNSRICSTPFH